MRLERVRIRSQQEPLKKGKGFVTKGVNECFPTGSPKEMSVLSVEHSLYSRWCYCYMLVQTVLINNPKGHIIKLPSA